MFFQNHRVNFNQTWHKSSLGEEDSSSLKWRAKTPLKVEIIAKAHVNFFVIKFVRCLRCPPRDCCKLFTFSSSPPEPLISTKIDTNHLWVRKIQVCSNEGACVFQGEKITKKGNYIDENLKKILQNHWANFHKAILGEGDSTKFHLNLAKNIFG